MGASLDQVTDEVVRLAKEHAAKEAAHRATIARLAISQALMTLALVLRDRKPELVARVGDLGAIVWAVRDTVSEKPVSIGIGQTEEGALLVALGQARGLVAKRVDAGTAERQWLADIDAATEILEGTREAA